MQFVLLIPSYLGWHYRRALREYFGVSGNFIWFLWNFFSIGLLSRTLFARYKRIGESYKRGFDLGDFLSTLLVNVLMRLVGFFIRSIVIVIGLVCIVAAVMLLIAGFFIWILLPLVILVLVLFGLYNLISQ